uniref:Matrin-type domain-containing protein n=1 Tax=Angiostrongylus cantonensis TaxID=6313 RepID=A0A0K0CWK7_ANGCA
MSFYEEAGSSAVGIDHRRKWDQKKAIERLKAEKLEQAIKSGQKPKEEPKVKRELLKARDYKVDLESKLGRSVVINKTTPAAETGGYYCDVCDCVVKDSINFLDHINGKNHQRNMGMSMKIRRSTLEEVKERFKLKLAEKEQEKKQRNMEEILGDVCEEEAKMNDYKKEKKAEQRKRKLIESAPDEGIDPELQAMMGFGGFGTTKKK